MLKLIQNEHMKWFHKRSTKVTFITIGILTLCMALLMKKVANSAGTEDNILNFLSFSSGMLILVQFFALAVGGSMVAKEFEAGTIKLLLIRPARRSTILASKYLTLILISLYYLLSYLLFSFVWGALFFGFTSLEGDAQLLKNITLTYDSAYMETFMMMTFAFMLSSLFRNSALASSLAIVVSIGAKAVTGLVSQFGLWWGKFLLFANTNFVQYMDGMKTMFDGMTIPFSIFILVAHFVFFMGVAWVAFLKRDVAN